MKEKYGWYKGSGPGHTDTVSKDGSKVGGHVRHGWMGICIEDLYVRDEGRRRQGRSEQTSSVISMGPGMLGRGEELRGMNWGETYSNNLGGGRAGEPNSDGGCRNVLVWILWGMRRG